MATLLILTANPQDTGRLEQGEEVRAIKAALRSATYRSIEVIECSAARSDDVVTLLGRHRPHIVHLSGHCLDTGDLVLTGEHGESMPVTPQAMGAVFRMLNDSVALVVLNGCHTRAQAAQIVTAVDCSIGVDRLVEDETATAFVSPFYRALGSGASVRRAYTEARASLLMQGRGDADRYCLVERTPNLAEECYFVRSSAKPDTPEPGVISPVTPEMVDVALRGVALMRFIGLPAGEFVMGEAAEGHRAEVSAFTIAEYPVTQKQWRMVMGTDPSHAEYGAGDEYPMHTVNWRDAIEFANALSRREGCIPCYQFEGEGVTWLTEADGYRLPTEAEWEYACRAGTQTTYSFGKDRARLGDHAWFKGNAGGQVQPVGRKLPNGWGLHDMHGNVWEWCWGRHGDPPGSQTRALTGDGVLRGGSWFFSPADLRCAKRLRLDSTKRDHDVGFRCVRSVR